MKLGRGNFCPAFRPAGGFAGGRFALRRFISVPRLHAWSRIVLRWRRTRARPRYLQTRIAAPTASSGHVEIKNKGRRSRISYFQHFHFQFVLGKRERKQGGSTPAFAPPVRSSGERIEIETRSFAPTKKILPRQLGRADSSLAAIPKPAGTTAIEHVHVWTPRAVFRAADRSTDNPLTGRTASLPSFVSDIGRRSPVVRRFMLSGAQRDSRRIVSRISKKIRSTTPIEDAAEPRPRRVQSWEYGKKRSLVLRPEAADVPWTVRTNKGAVSRFPDDRNTAAKFDRERKRPVARFADERTAELVWRRAPHKSSEDESFEHDSARHTDRTRTSTNSQSANQSVVDVERIVERVTAKQMTKLDSAILDRLTDNVISRVEKRIKIERQRRGL